MKIEQRHMEPINMNNVADTGFEILWQCLPIHKIKIMQQLDSFCWNYYNELVTLNICTFEIVAN